MSDLMRRDDGGWEATVAGIDVWLTTFDWTEGDQGNGPARGTAAVRVALESETEQPWTDIGRIVWIDRRLHLDLGAYPNAVTVALGATRIETLAKKALPYIIGYAICELMNRKGKR